MKKTISILLIVAMMLASLLAIVPAYAAEPEGTAITNEKEFLSLASVYLDAVFNPLAVKSENAFMQEGWHYEIDENGELSYKGVVLNEMRGD